MADQTPEYWADLGRRAVACGWRWLPGALRDDGHRFIGLDATNGEEHGFACPADEGGSVHWCWPMHLAEAQCIPDLSDPATRGTLRQQVREAYGDPMLWAAPDKDGTWYVYARLDDGPGFDGVARGATEAEALVAAWEDRMVSYG